MQYCNGNPASVQQFYTPKEIWEIGLEMGEISQTSFPTQWTLYIVLSCSNRQNQEGCQVVSYTEAKEHKDIGRALSRYKGCQALAVSWAGKKWWKGNRVPWTICLHQWKKDYCKWFVVFIQNYYVIILLVKVCDIIYLLSIMWYYLYRVVILKYCTTSSWTLYWDI